MIEHRPPGSRATLAGELMRETTDNGVTAAVYVVDDDDGMRRALHTLLITAGYKTIVYCGPKDFLAQFDTDAPGCLLLDIRMPEMSGLELQQQLNRIGAMIPVIFMTGHGDVPMAVQALKEGAFEFLQKPFRDQDLLDSINQALQRDAEMRSRLAHVEEVRQRFNSLSPRERQVNDMVVAGNANKVMAIDLGLSERTVEIHRAKVMEKMGARSVAHLVKLHLSLGGA
jgi:two-component system, LuxR family, response regulator FixJ